MTRQGDIPDTQMPVHSAELWFALSPARAAALLPAPPADIRVHEPAWVVVAINATHRRAEVIVRLRGSEHVVAAFERVAIQHRCPADEEHLDVRSAEGLRILSCSWAAEEPRYAGSDIPSMLELRGGTYDPPTVRVHRHEPARRQLA